MSRLRLAFFICLLANMMFFVYAQGYLGNADGNREPQRLDNQLAPDKLKLTNLLQADAPPAPGVAPPEAKPAAAASQAEPAVAKPVAAVTPEPKPAALLCRKLSAATETQLTQLQSKLKANFPKLQSSLLAPTGTASYWVHIPALASRSAAEKKVEELRRLGVSESHIMSEDSPHQNAISLGLFRNEQSARDMLAALNKKGVRSARIEVRGTPGTSQLTVQFEAAQLTALQAMLAAADITSAECAP